MSSLTSYTPLHIPILNPDHEMDTIYVVCNGEDPIP